MNSKLYFIFSRELENAQLELKTTTDVWNKNKNEQNKINVDLARVKFNQWQKAVNYLYLEQK